MIADLSIWRVDGSSKQFEVWWLFPPHSLVYPTSEVDSNTVSNSSSTLLLTRLIISGPNTTNETAQL